MSSRASLNHVYRTVWNEALGAMVAIAEIGSAHQGTSSASASASSQAQGRSGHAQALLPLLGPLAIGVALAWGAPQPAHANPTGGVAVVGQATVTTQGKQLTVTTQNGAGTNFSAIDWQTFSVGAGETTRIQQPNAGSLSINRVVTSAPSVLYGTLSSNGKVVLVNQGGIAVSAGAVVDTAGFTASALTMSDQDALAGRLRFGSATAVPQVGDIKIQGNIIARGGDVVLVAPSIEMAQSSLVAAAGGTVVLAAGQSVEVTGRGLEGISLQVQAPTDSAINLGTLRGDAVGIFAGSLKHSGLIQATTATLAGGKVVLQAQGDSVLDGNSKIVASSATGQGGHVEVLGNHVGLIDNASIDASGASGGGTILVGGDYQGKNAAVQNASVTFVGANSVLNANATASGDGGKVIVWADDTTRAYGHIAVRGGQQGGNGGFVETSGKRALDVGASFPDTTAPAGTAGLWLLDPEDISFTISVPINISGGPIFSPLGAGGSTINTTTLVNYLQTSGNATIDTTGGSLTGLGNIIINAPIAPNLTAPTTLTFKAHNTIQSTTGGSITASGSPLNVVMIADQDASGLGDVTVGETIFTNGGNFSATGVGITMGAPVNAGAGTMSLTALGASGVGIGNATGAGVLTAANLALNSAANILILGANNVSTVAASAPAGSIDIRVDTVAGTTVGMVGTTSGLVSQQGVNLAQNSTTGGLVISSNIAATTTDGDVFIAIVPTGPLTGGIALNSSIVANANVTVRTTHGDIAFGSAGSISATGFVNGRGNITVAPGTTLAGSAWGSITGIGALTSDNFVNLDAGTAGGTGAISLSGPVIAPSITTTSRTGTSLTNVGNAISALTANNFTSGAVSITNAANMTLSVNNPSSSGSVVVRNTGGVTLAGAGITSGAPADAVILSTGGGFNDGGLNIAVPGASRWLVFSKAPGLNSIGTLLDTASSFQQYGATYPASAVLGTGSGVLYSDLSPPLGITLVGGVSKIFDGTTTATLTTANYNLVGPFTSALWAGEASSSLLVTSPGTGVYDTANAGVGKAVTSTGGKANGFYTAGRVIYGLEMGVGTSSIGTITGATLTAVVGSLTGTTSKTYDGTLGALLTPSNYLLTGFIGTDGAVVTQSVGSYTSKNVGTGLSVTALLTAGDFSPAGSTLLANYILPTSVTGNIGVILPKALTVGGLQAVNKEYDGSLTDSLFVGSATINGVLPSDTVTVSSAIGFFDTKDVGTGKQVTLGSVQFGGADGQNYTFVPVGLGVADITRRERSNWIGAAGGLWSDPKNWDAIPDKSNVLAVTIPEGVGNIIFDGTAGDVTLGSLQSSRPIEFSGSKLLVGGDIVTPGLAQSAGSITSIGAVKVTNAFSQTGGSLVAGSLDAVQTTGDLVFNDISAPTVSLAALAGAIRQTGPLVSTNLTTASTQGTFLGGTGNKINQWNGKNEGIGDIALLNTGVVVVSEVVNSGGDITITNTGGLTSKGKISAENGAVTLTTNSPLTIEGEGVLAKGNVVLTATNLTSAGDMLLDAPIVSTEGSVNLDAANNFTQNDAVFGALGVTARAGGTLTYGPRATAANEPVNYFRGNIRVLPPPRPGGSPQSLVVLATNSAILALMGWSQNIFTGAFGSNGFWTPEGGRDRNNVGNDLIVSEGPICRP